MADNVHHMLLVTLSNIGDALMTTPVMEALHEKHPRAIMDLVTDPRSSELFTHCPYRGSIILRDKQQGWLGSLALVRALRRQRYDLIVDLRTDGLAWLLRGRRRLTRQGGARTGGGHAVERHMRIVGHYIKPSGIPPTRLWLSKSEQGFATRVLDGLPGWRWLALAPGARWAPKCWPPERYRALLQGHREHFDAVVLLGSHADTDRCRTVAEGLPLACLDLAGKTALLEAAAVLAHMRLFIGNDSGLGHLAAAARVPTLTLFGPGDPRRYHPWNTAGRWLQAPNHDIRALRVNCVADALQQLLRETGLQIGEGGSTHFG